MKCTDWIQNAEAGAGLGERGCPACPDSLCSGLSVCVSRAQGPCWLPRSWRRARDLQPTTANGGGGEEACGAAAPSRVTFRSARREPTREGSSEGTGLKPERGDGLGETRREPVVVPKYCSQVLLTPKQKQPSPPKGLEAEFNCWGGAALVVLGSLPEIKRRACYT